MTVKQLLGVDINDLEKMPDEDLRRYLAPYIAVVQPQVKPKRNVIDVENLEERKVKKKESLAEMLMKAQAMLEAQMKGKG